VSTLIRMPSRASASITGRIRPRSSSGVIGATPGAVDSPPTSIQSAPSATIARAWSMAASME